ncbi:MAG: tannase/feruloyl esterase family alpha/beta hydrolase [Vicinamibacterales bacterium]
MKTTTLLFGLIAIPALAHAQTTAPSCDQLAGALKLPNTTVTLAQLVPAGPFTPPAAPGGQAPQAIADLPAFCRVAATIAPTSDSDIKMEVWMPASGWNGRFQGVGNGGWAGSIQYGALAGAVKKGYAAASTDTGHVGGTAAFAVGHPEKLVDFAHRAVHEMAVQAKAVASTFYGSAPKYSYFVGCSNGGRQGFKSAQQYPGDFDGIVSGAPAFQWSSTMAASVAIAQTTMSDEANRLPADKLKVLHQAVIGACDAKDGVTDGVIENPNACTFDPRVLECKSGDGPACLTAAQVKAAAMIYDRDGSGPFVGLKPGSEPGWTQLAGGPTPFRVGDELFKYIVFKNPNWDFLTFKFPQDLELAQQIDKGLIDATDPNLKPFADRGGKLLVWHGWADQVIGSQHSIDYYNRVVATIGEAAADKAVRLFMAPGVTHCGGGVGPSQFDALAAVEQWVEQGKAPASLLASRVTDGTVDRTRPICAYPQVAVYTGTGSTDDAANFVCRPASAQRSNQQ